MGGEEGAYISLGIQEEHSSIGSIKKTSSGQNAIRIFQEEGQAIRFKCGVSRLRVRIKDKEKDEGPNNANVPLGVIRRREF